MTKPLLLHELPYTLNTADLFDALAYRPWAVFLDSCYSVGGNGRYDIFTAEPFSHLVTRGDETEITDSQGRVVLSLADPFTLVSEAMGSLVPSLPDIPFSGGAIGYFSYDLGRRLESLPVIALDTEDLPEMAVGIYDWAVIVDHQEKRCRLVYQQPEKLEQYLAWLYGSSDAVPHYQFPKIKSEVRPSISHSDYVSAVEKIQRYIVEGDCYQVNFAQRFVVDAEGDHWLAYKKLREINPAPHSAFLNLPFCQILSSSPERFLNVVDSVVETKPIKGTARRGKTTEEDALLSEGLMASSKDQAENLMIVDLMRNDLGKVCEHGSIQVPTLFGLESFATVHHLVSTVRGRLEQGQSALTLLRACFPGGSITGAPKIRAMEIIEELEPHRRGIYCGSIGYISADGGMDTSIAIRTMVHSEGTTRFWAGGGIVSDSDPEAEYQESLDKAAALLALVDYLSGLSTDA